MMQVVTGILSQCGRKWICIADNNSTAFVPFEEFHASARPAIERLGAQGFILPGQAAVKTLIDRVNRVTDFAPSELIERVGWQVPHFALPDGSVISPPGKAAPGVAFTPIQGRCSQRGRFSRWIRRVATPLAGQALGEFVMCLAFAPPLLSLTNRVGNFGFEIVGPKEIGKSRLQQLMSSALGGAVQGEVGHYWLSFDATPNALEQIVEGFADLPLIFEEAALFLAGESTKVRGNAFKALAFRLGLGSGKARFDATATRESRFIFLSSSNEPLAEVMGVASETASAALDRLITIPILESRRHGVFDFIPCEFEDIQRYIDSLINAANANHGHAIRQFLSRLVADRARDEKGLNARIAQLVAEFREHAGIDPAKAAKVRVADAFGLVYAAGVLAKEYGVLPNTYRPGRSVLACYEMHLQKDRAFPSFRDRLFAVSDRDDIIDLGAGRLIKLDEKRRQSAIAFLRYSKGLGELWVPPANIARLFPDWHSLKGRSDVLRCLKREGSGLKVKCPVGPNGKPVRVYCFMLKPS